MKIIEIAGFDNGGAIASELKKEIMARGKKALLVSNAMELKLLKKSGDMIAIVQTQGNVSGIVSPQILMIGNELKENEPVLWKDAVVIVDTQNGKAAQNLKEVKKVVTCGNHSKSTVAFSGTNDDVLLFSLQRQIEDLNGNVREECELIIKKRDNIDQYGHGAILTVLVLLGL